MSNDAHACLTTGTGAKRCAQIAFTATILQPKDARGVMLTEHELKQRLQPVAENDYTIADNETAFALALDMMPHVGSADAELRDELIYVTLAWWLERGVLTDAQQRELLTILRDDAHLFYRLGEQETDTVLTRSFSVLLIAGLIYRQRHAPYLTTNTLLAVKNDVLHYLAAEEDLRGYDVTKGWMHAVAHSADALSQLARCTELGATTLREILDAIRQAVGRSQVVYAYEEDERLATAAEHVIDRKLLTAADIEAWLTGFTQLHDENAPLAARLHTYVNAKHFLRSLYFRLYDDDKAVALLPTIRDTLASLQR
ncbi:MAG: DUF2785 domain-containing protein [Anaerolineae bacterium]|nr:DUF2785 domain-containing protein [Anaerolineae bacterium]MCO5203519.1 DUF2785 domain-containing protein [Anaerolineae bacterium]